MKRTDGAQPRRQRRRRGTGRDERYWRAVLAERQCKGLTFRETAARHGISQSQLYLWAKRLKEEPTDTLAKTAEAAAGFVEVGPSSAWQWPTQSEYRVQFPSGLVLTVPTAVAPTAVGMVIGEVVRAVDPKR